MQKNPCHRSEGKELRRKLEFQNSEGFYPSGHKNFGGNMEKKHTPQPITLSTTMSVPISVPTGRKRILGQEPAQESPLSMTP